ncbi:MAG: hypothetical protein KAT35_05510 [Candidatus Aenigmarchaeota archaeon]|nr:hypothetical protein [Candidatus Aenigmarchaeota archaeon]
MQPELKPDINLIVIAGNVEVEGHQLVSKKFLQIINHVLTETELMTEAFQLDPECIRKISLLPNFDDLGKEYEGKFGFFKASTKEVAINLKGCFTESVECVKEADGAELLSLRAHLWYQVLTTMFHEFSHAVLFAIEPEIAEKNREEVEDSIAEDALEEMASFIMAYESEPPAWANEPFFGILFMDFMINEVRDNAEAWALAQKDIHEYNERNNTRIVWKDGDTAVNKFRRWFKVSNEYTDWDDSYDELVELKFSLPVPTVDNVITDDTLVKPGNEVVEALHEALKDDVIPWEESPFVPETVNMSDLEGTIELPASELPSVDESDEAHINAMYEWTEPDDVVQDNKAVEGTKDEDYALEPDPAGETPVLTKEELILDPDVQLTQDEMDHMGSEDVEDSHFDDDDENHLHDEVELPVFPTPAPKTEHFTGHGTGQYAGPETKPAPATETVLPPAPGAETPTFAPTSPAPTAGVAPPLASPQLGAEAPVYNNQALRTGLPNHNFTGEQMKTMCEEVFKRCVNHIFTKCGWAPGQNPSFVAEMRGSIMEPISMSGIPNIDKFLIGLDITDPATGQYIVNSPYTAHAGMIKGKVTKNQGLPSYTLYFNYNGMEIKRFIAPQNQWKVNKAGTGYSAPAVSAQNGAQIVWIMDGADDSSKKWRCKFENGVLQWFV